MVLKQGCVFIEVVCAFYPHTDISGNSHSILQVYTLSSIIDLQLVGFFQLGLQIPHLSEDAFISPYMWK